jgi:trk system potassium uptake protein TrkH
MRKVILDLPLLVILMGLSSLVMYVPAAHGLIAGPMWVARPFFYGGTILLVCSAMLGIATANYQPRDVAKSQLFALVGAFFILPPMLALPFHQAMPHLAFKDILFDMVSALTTTGFDTFKFEAKMPDTIQLWRALVGWFGGLLILVGAGGILVPLGIGGAEVMSSKTAARQVHQHDATKRIIRGLFAILPLYGGATLVLWLLLIIAGEQELTAFCHALSTLSTSGISPVGGMNGSEAPFASEFFILCAFMLTLTRRSYGASTFLGREGPIYQDPELRLAVFIVLFICATIFLRHFIAAPTSTGIFRGLEAFWGLLFTSVSFLTTTGFVSVNWNLAGAWSGLGDTALILVGLCLIGGGVCTTTGGIKLLRAAALIAQVSRELDRIIVPNSVGGSGKEVRQLRREGAHLAWVYVMLVAATMVVVLLALALININFHLSVLLAISAFTNTGPLLNLTTEMPVILTGLPLPEQGLLAFAMILGRLEVLALIALLIPQAWRS